MIITKIECEIHTFMLDLVKSNWFLSDCISLLHSLLRMENEIHSE